MPVPLRFVFALLAVCAAIQTARAQVVETSDKEDTTGMPRVVFFRPPGVQDHGFPVAVYCDLTKVAELRNNTYFEIALSPGTHVCSTELLGTRHTIGDTENVHKEEELALQVKPGPKQWVSVHFKTVGLTKSTFRLSSEDPAQASKEVEKKHTQPVKPEQQTIRSISRTTVGSSGK
jgi:hypothetical protein